MICLTRQIGKRALVHSTDIATGKTSTAELRDAGAHHVATNSLESLSILNQLIQRMRNA